MQRRSEDGSGTPDGDGNDRGTELLPAAFRERMAALLGAEAEAFFEALLDPPGALRVNTLRISPERFRALAPWPIEPLAFPRAGFEVHASARAGRDPFHAAGLYYLQDAGAMAVAALLDPRPGERVLDLAAAPGGKSTHLAALMEGRGLLVCNDVQPIRVRELIGNLERCGVGNALVTQESVERLAAQFGDGFDRVLLDAPCSGEAMFHKSMAARDAWSDAAVLGCARRQADLLRAAAPLVRPGGMMVYSTCTFSPEEDEEVVAAFIRDVPGWEIAELPAVPGGEPGRPEWVPPDLRGSPLHRTLRLWPHRVAGAGHFVAGLRRHDADPQSAVHGSATAVPGPRGGGEVPRDARRLWERFRDEHLGAAAAADGALMLRGSELYLLPPDTPDTGRLRVERPGLWLGTIRNDRFIPAHALAMALPGDAVHQQLDLERADPAVRAWLRGEVVRADGRAGWVRVAVSGFPLGWGKRVGDAVKNHYPKGLRWRS
jgi:NOL1/NOP2/sun family putative RNA methylase